MVSSSLADESVSARSSSIHRRAIWVHDGCEREQKD
jgi:hypothetical protein